MEWVSAIISEEEKGNDSNKLPPLFPKPYFPPVLQNVVLLKIKDHQEVDDDLSGSLLSWNTSQVTTLGFCIGISFYMWVFRMW